MEVVAFDFDLAKLLGGDLFAGGIAAAVEASVDDETGSVGRVSDQVDDRFVGAKGPPAPVGRDEGEEPVLDLVPLAGAWREVADVDRDSEFIGKALQLVLPDVRTMPVAAACIGRDEDLACTSVALGADLIPPRRDRGDGEHRCVVVDADAHEAGVGREVIDTVRNRLADGGGWKVVNIDQLGLAARFPFARRS